MSPSSPYRVVPDDDLDAEVDKTVSTLRDKSANTLRLAKRLLDQGWQGSSEEVMSRETAASVEAAAAFSEGKRPRFRI